MSAISLCLLIDIDMYYLLPIYQQISNETNSAAKVDYFSLVFSNACVDQNWKMNFM